MRVWYEFWMWLYASNTPILLLLKLHLKRKELVWKSMISKQLWERLEVNQISHSRHVCVFQEGSFTMVWFIKMRHSKFGCWNEIIILKIHYQQLKKDDGIQISHHPMNLNLSIATKSNELKFIHCYKKKDLSIYR